ncbi:RNA methyltransferase [Falsiporphyromonas endometrii]|uniref:RNA methyltransferase n=1 Tax=Falsiporphyromonas endometrii TaxID=1387297 RepID=A0ABV9KAM1_9PORP|nr:RNA methyltransferase [Porphyromonadaceae bacterium]
MRKLKTIEIVRHEVEECKDLPKIPLVLILDDIRSMNNVGSVLRTADAFRLESVCLCGITAHPPHPDIHKTALGAEDSVAWTVSDDPVEEVKRLKSQGYLICALELATDSVMLQDVKIEASDKIALILGNEVFGVKQELIDLCDYCFEIPQFGVKHSLNVSVATGIAVWQIASQMLDKLGE